MIVTDLSNSFHPCPKQKNKTEKVDRKTGQMRQKSKKMKKLERQRDKGLTKSGICQCCGKYSKRLDPHEVYGGSNRQRSIKHKFVKLLCSECHSNENVINQLRKDVQKEFEETHTREDFIQIFGKSYL